MSDEAPSASSTNPETHPTRSNRPTSPASWVLVRLTPAAAPSPHQRVEGLLHRLQQISDATDIYAATLTAPTSHQAVLPPLPNRPDPDGNPPSPSRPNLGTVEQNIDAFRQLLTHFKTKAESIERMISAEQYRRLLGVLDSLYETFVEYMRLAYSRGWTLAGPAVPTRDPEVSVETHEASEATEHGNEDGGAEQDGSDGEDDDDEETTDTSDAEGGENDGEDESSEDDDSAEGDGGNEDDGEDSETGEDIPTEAIVGEEESSVEIVGLAALEAETAETGRAQRHADAVPTSIPSQTNPNDQEAADAVNQPSSQQTNARFDAPQDHDNEALATTPESNGESSAVEGMPALMASYNQFLASVSPPENRRTDSGAIIEQIVIPAMSDASFERLPSDDDEISTTADSEIGQPITMPMPPWPPWPPWTSLSRIYFPGSSRGWGPWRLDELSDIDVRPRMRQGPLGDWLDVPRVSGADGDAEDTERPPPLEDQALVVRSECHICLEQLANVVLIPCGHLCMCQWCATQFVVIEDGRTSAESSTVSNSICPMCRRPIYSKVRDIPDLSQMVCRGCLCRDLVSNPPLTLSFGSILDAGLQKLELFSS
ncbi:MAG: hypothetical protein M1817_000913 [Caeruleum heppii]|nr:MAG: hypothetical protein M1817_000913 [Caeruleum heppii]